MISIVIPVYNEEESISILYRELKSTLDKLKRKYEIIFVDDGSRDNSFNILKDISKSDKSVRIVRLQRNFGQSAAFDAGFDNSKGDIIITLDADLQNNPEDIPMLLNKLDEGWDMVCGWRYNRKDPFFKKFTSKIANWLRRKLTRERIHDSGCSLRVFKKECIKGLNMYGEMHRYIPYLVNMNGFKVTEMKVRHYPRKFGKTKYNAFRVFRGFLDLFYVKFWSDYSTRPLHLFGGFGLLQTIIGGLVVTYQLTMLAVLYFYFNEKTVVRPMLFVAIFLIISGLLFILFGFLAEIQIRVYYESTNKKPYKIKNV